MGFGNNEPDPYGGDIYQELMEEAQSSQGANSLLAMSPLGKKNKNPWGYNKNSFDQKTGAWTLGSMSSQGVRGGFQQRYGAGWHNADATSKSVAASQLAEISKVIQNTLGQANVDAGAEKKATSLLGKIEAKSSFMEDLITKRRQVREEEVKQTRGLY